VRHRYVGQHPSSSMIELEKVGGDRSDSISDSRKNKQEGYLRR
jgi:hypothetical protein